MPWHGSSTAPAQAGDTVPLPAISLLVLVAAHMQGTSPMLAAFVQQGEGLSDTLHTTQPHVHLCMAVTSCCFARESKHCVVALVYHRCTARTCSAPTTTTRRRASPHGNGLLTWPGGASRSNSSTHDAMWAGATVQRSEVCVCVCVGGGGSACFHMHAVVLAVNQQCGWPHCKSHSFHFHLVQCSVCKAWRSVNRAWQCKWY
jgi:hypothetical protein